MTVERVGDTIATFNSQKGVSPAEATRCQAGVPGSDNASRPRRLVGVEDDVVKQETTAKE